MLYILHLFWLALVVDVYYVCVATPIEIKSVLAAISVRSQGGPVEF